MHLVVDMDMVDVDVVLRVLAIRLNDMGVPAPPSGVFQLRFAPVPPKNRRDFPSAPLTLAGRCGYRIRARAPHGVVLRCRSGKAVTGDE